MQAGLAIIVGPELVEMSRIVRDCKCGAVPEEHTPESTALLLNRITSSELEMMKKNSNYLIKKSEMLEPRQGWKIMKHSSIQTDIYI